MNRTTIIAGVIGLVVVIGVLVSVQNIPADPGKYDGFAQCLKDKGLTFFGACWCPHCQAQKALFGSSVHLLPYVECSTPDAQGQTQVCKDNKIESYPTWVFADHSTTTGEVPLATLSEKTSCPLPI